MTQQELPPTGVGVTDRLVDPPFGDVRVRRAAAAFARAEGRSAASAAGTTEAAMVELFLIVSGYLGYGAPFPGDGAPAIAVDQPARDADSARRAA